MRPPVSAKSCQESERGPGCQTSMSKLLTRISGTEKGGSFTSEAVRKGLGMRQHKHHLLLLLLLLLSSCLHRGEQRIFFSQHTQIHAARLAARTCPPIIGTHAQRIHLTTGGQLIVAHFAGRKYRFAVAPGLSRLLRTRCPSNGLPGIKHLNARRFWTTATGRECESRHKH